MRETPAEEDGFSLLAVLAVLTLLAVVAIGLQKTIAVDVRFTSNIAQRLRAETVADGLTRLVVHHLVINPPGDGRSGLLRLNGLPLTCRIGDALASITVINTDGQINLNLAPLGLLTRALGGIGLSDSEALRLAQDIVDFRTLGDQSINGGSKLANYVQAGLRHGPKGEPFQSVGELEQVIGMTPALLERLRPLVTVHSLTGVVNPGLMSRPVAVALAGGNAASTGDPAVLAANLDLPSEFTFVPRRGRGAIVTASNTVLVRAAVNLGGTARFTREAVIELTATTPDGPRIRDWSGLDPDLYGVAPPDTDDVPACLGGALWLNPG